MFAVGRPAVYNEHMFSLDAIAVNGQPLSRLQLCAEDFYEWQPLEISCAPQPGVAAARLRIGDADLGPPMTTLGDPVWRWRWNPQHAIGRFLAALTLRSVDGSEQSVPFELRIVPRRLDRSRYEALIQAVQHDAYALVYALSGGHEGATLRSLPEPRRTLVEEYWTLVERHVAEAVALTRQIAARPQQQLRPGAASVELAEAERLDLAALAEIARGPLDDLAADLVPPLQAALRPAGRTRGGPLPRMVRAARSSATHDLPEHRLLKHVLQLLLWRVGFVRTMVRRELLRRQRAAQLTGDDSPPRGSAPIATLEIWQGRCGLAQRSLRQLLALPWLAQVGALQTPPAPTHLLRRDPRYRRLHALYQALHAAPFLALDSPTLWLPIAELPLLYEQWCALQVVRAVLPLGALIDQQLVSRAEAGTDAPHDPRWTLRLRQDGPLVTLRLADGRRLSVFYQRRYRPQPPERHTLGALDPFVRIPDVAIEIQREGASPEVLIYDAKYRVAPDGGVPQDALDDAYAYRSAIGVAGARATLGAYLLFPGQTPLATADQVGALPLLPDQPAELAALLRERLGVAAQPMAGVDLARTPQQEE